MTGYLWVEPISNSNPFLIKVYNWMILALFISGFTSYLVASNISIFSPFFKWGLLLIFLLEIIIVIAISWLINRISYFTALFLFLFFSIINWFTLSAIFFVYPLWSIMNVLFITASIFAFMSLYWYYTKSDLSTFGSIIYMWLFWLVIATIVNIFVANSFFDYILSWVWVLVFTWLVAYDTNKIKEMGNWLSSSDELFWKMAIIWALNLYLDFINLFLNLLKLFWWSRD